MSVVSKDNNRINSLHLRIIGAAVMICDSIWTYLVPGRNWLMLLRWFAFTVFAFLLTEGFNNSSNRRLYAFRLTFFAVLSEIPYNLMVAKAASFPRDQNVMFTLLTGLASIAIVKSVKDKMHNTVMTGLTAVLASLGGSWLASNLGFEMGSCGIWIIMIFYISSGVRYPKLMEFASLLLLTAILASDYIASPIIGGYRYFMPAQAFTLIALPFIWLYKGDRGPNGLWTRRVFYIFYPAMCLIIGILENIL